MADTAHKNDEEKKEYFDDEDTLNQKIDILTQMVLQSKHFIAFTGAGISTSCGIPDFRSGIGTVLPTGPGVWEKAAQKLPVSKAANKLTMIKALPSYTHMALVKLQEVGLLKFLISQNVDGLHRRSGFPPKFMAELHGNTNLEKCQKCHKEYMRDFRVRTAQKVHEHKTGRKCDNPKCGGMLYDSIINFGENLPQADMEQGFKNSEKADLCLAMGSSLRVTPAADMPKIIGQKQKNLVVVNLQTTPLDNLCALRIYALCDKVMEKLMQNLKIQVQKFVLKRWVQITTKQNLISIRGVDSDNSPYTFIKEFKTKTNGKQITQSKEPYNIQAAQLQNNQIEFQLDFFSHYDEPSLPMKLPVQFQQEKEIIKLVQIEYDPFQKKWINVKQV